MTGCGNGTASLQAPFVWFGGKRRVASEVWAVLGDVDNYVEPFAGSLAVLLGRPARHRRRCETVNDADAFLANFWRALAADPEAVAYHADGPVNETDLFARHLWLVNTGRDRLRQLEADPGSYDPAVAGW
jgi:site-specific DNA-adenine methylase